MADDVRPSVEYYARKMAFWHGQKVVMVRNGQKETVASLSVGDHWGDADRNWHQYMGCAEYIMERFHKEAADASG